ncbi:hypothetical protein Baya_7131 [Bagarius yarrelli]|uniref:Secreted protein n=1 Tax=Bagarius yarrelli TaxID=175774 RepID=A0A556TZC6_BAGYA|nr:hypothetical protein Baya_7131 [Bagarius yarrelli]
MTRHDLGIIANYLLNLLRLTFTLAQLPAKTRHRQKVRLEKTSTVVEAGGWTECVVSAVERDLKKSLMCEPMSRQQDASVPRQAAGTVSWHCGHRWQPITDPFF